MKKYIRPAVKDEQTAITAHLMNISDVNSNLPDEDKPTPGGGSSGEGRARSFNIWDDED